MSAKSFPQGDHNVIHFQSFRMTLGFRPLAAGDTAVAHALGEAIAALGRQDEAARDARTAKYDAADISAALQSSRGRVYDAVRDVRAAIAKQREAALQECDCLLSPPRPRDAIEATEDAEIRSRVRRLSESARETLSRSLTSGKDQRVLLALARDPLSFEEPLSRVSSGLYADAQRRGARATEIRQTEVLLTDCDNAEAIAARIEAIATQGAAATMMAAAAAATE